MRSCFDWKLPLITHTGRELRSGVKRTVVTIVTGSLWSVRRYRWGQVNLKTISTIASHQSQRYISRRNTFRREMYRCDYCDGIVEAKCISIQFQRYRHTNHSEPVTIVKTIHFTPERSSLPVTQAISKVTSQHPYGTWRKTPTPLPTTMIWCGDAMQDSMGGPGTHRVVSQWLTQSWQSCTTAHDRIYSGQQ